MYFKNLNEKYDIEYIAIVINKNSINAFIRREYYDEINKLLPSNNKIIFHYGIASSKNNSNNYNNCKDNMFLILQQNNQSNIISNIDIFKNSDCYIQLSPETIKKIETPFLNINKTKP